MLTRKQRAFAAAVLTSFAAPSHAFLTELVAGMTSVTNNLIDSGESITNNTINAASTNMLSLTSNPGKMADRIGLMADRIGFMADRIVTTEGLMAGLAHKIIDSNSQSRVMHQYASAYAPIPAQPISVGYNNPYANSYGQGPQHAAPLRTLGGNPYLAAKPAPAVMHYGSALSPDNSRYSASSMIYGVTGATYTAARPAAAVQTQSAYSSGFSPGARASAGPTTAGNSCGYSYGVTRSC
jgi:hypothetical protein